MIDMTKYSKRFYIDGDYLVTGYGDKEKRINRYVDFDFDLGYVIGSYLSVGISNISSHKNSFRGLVFWYVPYEKEEKLLQLNGHLQNSFSLSLVLRKQRKASTIQAVCYSKPLAEFFSLMGKKSGKKYLPNEFFEGTPKPYLNGVLKGIEDFDGHRPDFRDVLNKKTLNIQVIELYNLLKNY